MLITDKLSGPPEHTNLLWGCFSIMALPISNTDSLLIIVQPEEPPFCAGLLSVTVTLYIPAWSWTARCISYLYSVPSLLWASVKLFPVGRGTKTLLVDVPLNSH